MSGGVAVGAIADLMLQPGGAFVMGTICGVVSAFGYRVLQVLLSYSDSITDIGEHYIIIHLEILD